MWTCFSSVQSLSTRLHSCSVVATEWFVDSPTVLMSLTACVILSGAIPFVRSNVPPILMAWETANSVFGQTSNPWNKTRVSGGSSGGEAALISSRCSPLGIGTDIGGSLRIPAACCGIYSLKPTTRRVTTLGLSCQEVPGQNTILSSPGPMGRTVNDLDLIMRAWLGCQPQPQEDCGDVNEADSETLSSNRLGSPLWVCDPYTPPVPWRGILTPVSGECVIFGIDN
jgi:Asp-tRNA(Asn)/Glu-tRNA(Gln) amidotransferase A subunit family amidase